MRIVIDLQSLQGTSRNRGIGRYCLDLSKELARQAAKKHEIYLLLNFNLIENIDKIYSSFNTLIPDNKIKIFEAPKKISGADYKNSWKIQAAEKIREHFIASICPDVVYISSIFEGFVDDSPVSIGEFQKNFLTAATLYDLIPFIYKDIYIQQHLSPNFFFQKMQYLKRSDLLITLSDSASQEAREHLSFQKDKIINCSVGIDPKFKINNISMEDRNILKNNYNINRDYIFYIGGFDFRKNIIGLIESFFLLPNILQNKFQLVIILSIDELKITNFINSLKQRFKFEDEIILISYVPEDILIILYNSCSLFVFPSLHEGFGLPILEAMACGAPTISSNISSMPEAIGCKDALFNPKKSQDIANKITEVLTDENFRNFLKLHGQNQVKKFTWENTAKKVLSGFENLYDTKKINNKFSVIFDYNKKKLAFISFFPPEKTKVSNYSSNIVPELACFYEIVLITNQETVEDSWLNANFSIHNISWFNKHASYFDVILYQFDNNPSHYYMIDLLYSYPGIIVLHDFFLSKIFDWIDLNIRKKSSIFNKILYESHGYFALLQHEKKGRDNTIKTYPCNLSVLKRSLGIIVNSKNIIKSSERWYGHNITQKFKQINPIYLDKNLLDEDKLKAREELEFTKKDFIVCFSLNSNKFNHQLISLLINNFLDNDDIYVIFTGEKYYALDYKYLLTLIDKNKIAKKFRVEFFSEKNIFKKYLIVADLAIQFFPDNEDSISDSILTYLSYGITTITTEHDGIDEIPSDTIIKLKENFTDLEIISHINNLYKDINLRRHFSERALEYIHKNYHPAKIGKQYKKAIDDFSTENNFREQVLIKNLAEKSSSSVKAEDLLEVAAAISENRPAIGFPKLLIDISEIINNKYLDSCIIQQNNLLIAIINNSAFGLRVEPIYYNSTENKYFYAINFTTCLLNLPTGLSEDIEIDANPGDIYLALSPFNGENISIKNIYTKWKIKNIKFYVLILSDKIPINNFLYEICEGCICLKKEYIKSLIFYLNANIQKRNSTLKIDFIDYTHKNLTHKLFNIIQKNQWSNEWNKSKLSVFQKIS